MLSKTHIAIGLAGAAAILTFHHDPELLLISSVSLIGGCLLPDLDEEHSYLNSKLFIPSIILTLGFLIYFIYLGSTMVSPKDLIVLLFIVFFFACLQFILIRLFKHFNLYNNDIKSSEIIFLIPGKLVFLLTFIAVLCIHKSLNTDAETYLFSTSVLIFFLSILSTLFTVHRSFSHSLLGIFCFSISIFLLNSQVFLPFLIGYSLHILADICSNNGVELLFPLRKRFSLINITHGLINRTVYTGSNIDRLIGKISLFSALLILSLKSMASMM